MGETEREKLIRWRKLWISRAEKDSDYAPKEQVERWRKTLAILELEQALSFEEPKEKKNEPIEKEKEEEQFYVNSNYCKKE